MHLVVPCFQWFIINKSLLCMILCCNIVAYGMQSTTYVDEVFGGNIVSSVTCQEVRGHIQYTPHIHVHVDTQCIVHVQL